MFLKNFHIIFILFLVLGTVMAFSANTWFTCWLGLEINLMSMIPLILNKMNSNFTEAAIKYFITQAMASILLIIPASMNLMTEELMSINTMELILAVSLSMKAGLAPFHFWFPQVIFSVSWTQALIIFTWQKLAPLILLSSLKMNIIFMITSISALTGALGGYNQFNLKLIMTYSSISHSSWLLMSTLINIKNWMIYFFIYCFLSMTLILFFMKNKIKLFNEISQAQDSKSNKYSLILNMLSLGGLPPFLGFTAKMNVILPLINLLSYVILMPLILSSLVSLFFYCRLIYSNFLINSNKVYKKEFNVSKLMSSLMSLSLFMNILSPAYFLI